MVQGQAQKELLLVALLNSDPALCRRVAGAVDSRTAEMWNRAREQAEEAAAAAAATTAAHAGAAAADAAVLAPTSRQMRLLFVRSAVPFIGFGFFDNMIMLTVGGAIENTIGVTFGLSSLAAAGMGQMVSDGCGITLQGLIERFADQLGLPHPRLTLQQQQLRVVQSSMLASRIFGIVFGCSLGMFPLLLMPEPPRQKIVDEIAERLPTERREEFLSSVCTKRFAEGDTILAYGGMSNYVLFIEEGQVECVGRDADGKPFQVCIIDAGHSFGKPQLHCCSQVDLIAADGPAVVQYMEKDMFVRLSGEEGQQVWESTQQAEHTVYFTALGQATTDPHAVGAAMQGAGKTRMFAALPQKDKLKVLELAGVHVQGKFNGMAKEGKCACFADLSEETKHDALVKWQAMKIQAS